MSSATHDKQYPRFRLMARIEHAVLMVSFTILGVTGLPQLYAATPTGEWFINILGGIEFIRVVHRWMAFALVLGSFYHLFTSAYRLFVKREQMRMVPDKKDLDDLIGTVKHNLGLQEDPPKMRKFNFGEKFEYWAVVWGTGVMVLTGFMLWNPIATTRFLPGSVIPAALAAHGGEALLAILAIIVWHMYNVHVKHFNPSMFTGNMPRHQMEEEHALELERLEAGGAPWPEIDLPVLQHRRRIFLAFASISAVVIIGVLFWAFTFEETAITTLPAVTREILATRVPFP